MVSPDPNLVSGIHFENITEMMNEETKSQNQTKTTNQGPL
jgi:hypothetical protein